MPTNFNISEGTERFGGGSGNTVFNVSGGEREFQDDPDKIPERIGAPGPGGPSTPGPKIPPLDKPDEPSVPDPAQVTARQEVQENLEDPNQALKGKGLLQEAVELETKEDEFIDPLKHQADAIKATPITKAAVELAETPDMGEAEQAIATAKVTAMESAAAQLPPAEQITVANAVAFVSAEVAKLPPAEQAQAAEDVMVEDYESSLLTPEDMGQNLQRLKEEEPMIAASMTSEMNALLNGMENGEIPAWARPAVTLVENQLASRGISASSIAKDKLFNAIIQAAMPIAQTNANFKQDAAKTNYTAKVNAIFSDVSAENAAKQFNAVTINQKNQFITQLKAQVDGQNAARKDVMAQFNVQQINDFAKTQASFEQQTELFNTQGENARVEFNLIRSDNIQQFNAAQKNDFSKIDASFIQATNLSNAAATNRAEEVTATLEAQRQQFNAAEANAFTKSQASLTTQVGLANSTAVNATNQFNANQANQAATFQAGLDSQREQFNVQMASAIEQSNVSWRKQANQINTAIENQVNQTNTMNAFNLNNQALSFLWQEERDQAHWEFQADESAKDRRNRLEANVIANETAAAGAVGSWIANLTDGLNLIDKLTEILE